LRDRQETTKWRAGVVLFHVKFARRSAETAVMATHETPAEDPTHLATVDPVCASVASPSGWGRWWRRMADDGGGDLPRARQDFADSLADLPALDVQALRRLLERAGSLRELWYLRPEVFRSVALHRSELEARRRLARLNRHFGRPEVAPGLVAHLR
jgi:hypothetical protein